LAVALVLNDLVAWDRNRGLDHRNRLPRGHTVSAAQCLKMIPSLDPGRISGGAIWYDAMAVNTERLTLSLVEAACAEGATAANYVQAVDYLISRASVMGVRATDVLTQRELEIRSKLVVNAAGPWTESLADTVPGLKALMPSSWSLATNVIVNRRLFGDYAVGLSVGEYTDEDAVFRKGTRDLFFVPWRGGTIIGTFYNRFSGDAESCRIGSADIHRMLAEIKNAYPSADLGPDDICFVHAGLLPTVRGSRGPSADIQLMKRPVFVDSEAHGSFAGLLSLVGVKYTTAPQIAEDVVHAALAKLGRRRVSDGTTFLPAGTQKTTSTTAQVAETASKRPWENGMSVMAEHLGMRYGPKLGAVMEYCLNDEGQRSIDADHSILSGEVTYAVREEMAQRLSDVIFRRTDLGTFGYPGREAIERCARIMSRELGWTSDRMRSEIDATEQVYAVLVEAGCLELDGQIPEDGIDDGTAATSSITGER